MVIMGKHFVPAGFNVKSYKETAKLCRKPLLNSRWRVFHARRNNEMLQAVSLKFLFGAKIKIVFTSTAQRYPSWITRWLIRHTDGLITTSNIAAKYLPRKPDAIIPHGVDSIRFQPPEESKEDAWKSLNLGGGFGVGIFGRVRPQKGVDILIESMLGVFKRHPDCGASVVIVGETTKKYEPYLNALKRRVKASGFEGRFHFLGKQPPDDIPKLFRGMSVVTALSRNEGFGLTVLEAMSSGIPVIASTAGAWPDILQKANCGKLVRIEDIEETTSVLHEMLSLPRNKLEEIGRQGRELVLRDYRLDKEARNLVNFYRTLGSNTRN